MEFILFTCARRLYAMREGARGIERDGRKAGIYSIWIVVIHNINSIVLLDYQMIWTGIVCKGTWDKVKEEEEDGEKTERIHTAGPRTARVQSEAVFNFRLPVCRFVYQNSKSLVDFFTPGHHLNCCVYATTATQQHRKMREKKWYRGQITSKRTSNQIRNAPKMFQNRFVVFSNSNVHSTRSKVSTHLY